MTYYDQPETPGLQRPVVLGLLATVVVSGAFLAFHALSGGRAKAAPRPTATITSAAPASSTAQASPAPAAATSSGGGSGPRWDPAGVWVGYRHDQGGAVAAAGNYVTALYTHEDRSPGRERAVLHAVAASAGDADRMAGDFSAEDRALAALLGVPDLQQPGVIAYGRPAGYQVNTATADEVVVDVHVVGGQGIAGAAEDSGQAPREFVEVNRLRLVWSGGDWRLGNWSRLTDGGPPVGSLAAAAYTPFPTGEPQ